MPNRTTHFLIAVVPMIGIAACGGSGYGGADSDPPVTAPVSPPPPPPPPPPKGVNYVQLRSDPGDSIGIGQNYTYTNTNSIIEVTSLDGYLNVYVAGDENWSGRFQLPDAYDDLQPGSFSGLTRYPSHDPSVGGMNWSGEGRGCNEIEGWLVIDSASYHGVTLTGIDLQFEQHCEGRPDALHGEIHWEWDDSTSPPGPAVTPPPGAWEPPPGATPDSGNYVYLVSQLGDWIGGGGELTYDETMSVITVNAAAGHLSIGIRGNERWSGDFEVMNTLSQLEVGYYGDLQKYPSHNPAKGGLRWSGEGRACNTVTGWFSVDSVTYDGETLEAIDLRFEQHCDGETPAIFGKIDWDRNETTMPPGPVYPPPDGLWQPDPGTTPGIGSYIFLEGQPRDYIVGEGMYLYTGANSILSVDTWGWDNLLRVSVDGDESWSGFFQTMDILSRLEVGYYGDLLEYPRYNPTKGGLRWGGEGRSCGDATGWFVVDSVTYDESAIQAIDLRFGQTCDGRSGGMNGKIHWDVDDIDTPPGPLVPPPIGLWEPEPGVTPATGNYIYIDSEVGDYIGQGRTYLFNDEPITVYAPDAWVRFDVTGSQNWAGVFRAMSSLTQLEVGYYGELRDNPATGGLSWSGDGRACSTSKGWFVIDEITYVDTELTSIKLRFEQRCGILTQGLNGEISWSK